MRTINEVKKVLKAFLTPSLGEVYRLCADVVAVTIDIDSVRTHHEHNASKQQLKLFSEFATAMGYKAEYTSSNGVTTVTVDSFNCENTVAII